jgi:hypothetical protein
MKETAQQLFEANNQPANKKNRNDRNINAEIWLRYVWALNKIRLYLFRMSI